MMRSKTGGVPCGNWRSVPGGRSTYCIHTGGLRLPGPYHSYLEGERDSRLVVELLLVPPDAHPACAGPPGDTSGVSATAPPR